MVPVTELPALTELQVTVVQVTEPVPVLILLLFMLTVPQDRVPQDREPQDTEPVPALILLLFVLTVVQDTEPQDTVPEPAVVRVSQDTVLHVIELDFVSM